ncbi:MAG: DUF3298 and DUF4163 domain-containing protein [Enterocloster asparagiformis]|nr:DUF3298 and DUF4163 domain-containing protein [Enterocloster asparagiformis]
MQTISQHTLSDTMYFQNTPALNYKINYPQFTSTCSRRAAAAVNSFYRLRAKSLETYCRFTLYPQAVKDLKELQENGDPLLGFEFLTVFRVTCNSGCIVSLYMDQYEFEGGAHGSTLRTSQTWDFSTGKRLQLSDFYPHNPSWREDIQSQIQAGIARRLEKEPSTYFDDYAALVRTAFNPDSFYLTPEGLVIYYQQYDIAPYSTGIPQFSLPFRE